MYSNIAANKRKTVIMMVFFVGLVSLLAWLFGKYVGEPSLTVGVIIGGLVYALISYFSASKMAMAINGAKEVTKQQEPRLYRTVENLAISQGMPMPKVCVMDDSGLNAFATGRDPEHALVCATRGLLDHLDDTELEGVIAHEMGHVKNYDIRVSMMAFALVAVVSLIADFIFRISWFGGGDDDDNGGNQVFMILAIIAAILAPIIASLIQLAISRRREYLADATGALATRYPEGLALALEKIGRHSTLRHQNMSTAHLFIANPLKGRSLAALFSTHPPIEDRIRVLREMGRHE